MAKNAQHGSVRRKKIVTNTIVHIFLAVMCIVWLAPLAWIVIHSFRAEPGQFVTTFFPKNYTIANYTRLFTETGVLVILVNKLSKKLNTKGGILFGASLSSLIICLIGGQYPAIAIPAVAFKDVCDDMDINRAVLSRTLEDVGTMVAAIVPWSAWVIGYGVVLGGVTVAEFIPFTFLPMICPILSVINNFIGYGMMGKDEEVKYRPFAFFKKK